MSVKLHAFSGLAALTIIACSEAPLNAVVLPPAGIEDDLSDGLVGYWPLDEVSGAVTADQSGNGRHGQVAGGTWLGDGRFSGGLRLAAGDSVTVRSFPSAAPSFTVAAWLRLSSEQLAMNSQTWVSILSTETFVSGGWQLNIDNRLPRPRFDFAYWAPPLDGYLFVECECVEVDRWVHLAAVVDVDANRVTLYRNGSVGDQETRPADVPPGDSTLYFGRWNMDGRLLSGDLDDVALWNRALTSDEITALQARPTRLR